MTEQDQDASGRDYGFLMFLTLLNVMNFVDRQLPASFANWIVPDLGLTNTQFGLLTGLIFIFFYLFRSLTRAHPKRNRSDPGPAVRDCGWSWHLHGGSPGRLPIPARPALAGMDRRRW